MAFMRTPNATLAAVTDPAIVGRQITFNDIPVTVIGVLPSGFENVLSPNAEVWSALEYDRSLPLNGREWGHHLRMIGRLRPDASVDQARLELNAIAGARLEEFPRPQWAALSNGFIAGRLQDELDSLREDVIYLKVKLRRENTVSRSEYNDTRNQLESLRSRARGESRSSASRRPVHKPS